jgi:hypothetical protein
MWWIDSSIVVVDPFSLNKSKPLRVEFNGIVIRNLNMQGNFIHIGKFSLFVFFKVIQDASDELGSNAPASVGRQDSQRHNVQPLPRIVSIVILISIIVLLILFFCGVVAVLVNILDAGTRRTHDKAIPVRKLTEAFVTSLDDIFVIGFLILDRKTGQIHFSQLKERNGMEWKNQ